MKFLDCPDTRAMLWRLACWVVLAGILLALAALVLR